MYALSYDSAWAESFWTGSRGGRLMAELNIPKVDMKVWKN
jgi:hypothetical protein